MTATLSLHVTKAVPRSLDVGPVQVTVLPALAGQFAHFLLYRLHQPGPALTERVLIGSGSTDDIASCVQQATRAAQRAGAAR